MCPDRSFKQGDKKMTRLFQRMRCPLLGLALQLGVMMIMTRRNQSWTTRREEKLEAKTQR